eukprot:6240379-Alexandrium_andersonii.AAC.1
MQRIAVARAGGWASLWAEGDPSAAAAGPRGPPSIQQRIAEIEASIAEGAFSKAIRQLEPSAAIG